MARRRSANLPEEDPKEQEPQEKQEESQEEKKKRPLWIILLSAASVAAILLSVSFLLRIHAPALAEIPLGGKPVVAGIGVAGFLGAVYGLILLLLQTDPLKSVRTTLAKAADRLFERRAALILAPLAVVLALGTWWHWRSSASTPILRIKPDGVFAYFLADADQAVKPPRKTFEVRVEVREGAGEQRLNPRDDRAIDIGASESVLRWRATREQSGGEAPKRSFLGTPRLRSEDVVTIRVLCRRSGAELIRVRAPVSEEPFLLDGEDFDKRMESCDPI